MIKSILIGVATIVGFPLWLPLAFLFIIVMFFYGIGESVRGLFQKEEKE